MSQALLCTVDETIVHPGILLTYEEGQDFVHDHDLMVNLLHQSHHILRTAWEIHVYLNGAGAELGNRRLFLSHHLIRLICITVTQQRWQLLCCSELDKRFVTVFLESPTKILLRWTLDASCWVREIL
jgi:hypothetical protein